MESQKTRYAVCTISEFWKFDYWVVGISMFSFISECMLRLLLLRIAYRILSIFDLIICNLWDGQILWLMSWTIVFKDFNKSRITDFC